MRDIEGNHAKAKATQIFEIQSIPGFSGGRSADPPGEDRVSNVDEESDVEMGPVEPQKGLEVVEGAEGGLGAKGAEQGPRVSKIPRPGSRRSSRSPSPVDVEFILGDNKEKGNSKIQDMSRTKSVQNKIKGNGKNKEKGAMKICQ